MQAFTPSQQSSDINTNSPSHVVFYHDLGIKRMIFAGGIISLVYSLAWTIQEDLLIDICNFTLPTAMTILCFVSVYLRISNNTLYLWAPETWFLVYSGIQFGVGSLVYFSGNEAILYSIDYAIRVRGILLLKTNLLNSITITLVLIGTMFLPRKSVYQKKNVDIRFCKMLSIIFFSVFATIWILSKIVSVLPSSILELGNSSIISSMVINFFLWSKGDRRQAKWALLTLIVLTLFALPDFGKTVFLQNFLYAGLGYLLAKSVLPQKQFLAFTILLLLLLIWYRPISEYGRKQGIFKLTYQERLEETVSFILDERRGDSSRSSSKESLMRLWSRQNLNGIQAYLMDRYDRGLSGNSISEIWVYFIPRFLWPEKPYTTNIARVLNKMVFGYESSALAPSFNGDAYWNGGWPAVIGVSLYVGVVIAFFSRISLKHLNLWDLRVLPIAIAGINLGRYVEGFFASAFIGGVIIMGCMWLLIKTIIPSPNSKFHRWTN